MKLYQQSDFHTQTWSGGTTTQLAIYPPESDYNQRNFLWRFSTATVEEEHTTFTALPDYHRFITLVQGDMALSHEVDRVINLSPLQIHQFDGGRTTACQGRCTDFNLMIRKEACHAELEAIQVDGTKELPLPKGTSSHSALVLYGIEGEITLTTSQKEEGEISLKKGELALWDALPTTCTCQGKGTFLCSFLDWNPPE